MELYINSARIRQAMTDALPDLKHNLRERWGEDPYTDPELMEAMQRWLELSIEALVNEMDYHLYSGAYPFNRHDFEHALRAIDQRQQQDSGAGQAVA
ncbi:MULTISPECIES: hypothetical protein [unclassified Leptolyngbya]|jgi:hypothetical protein|uniref:hypothetical protein n=1 Tax=unclassified Leptolyngbya TaxID=2650499 RepID=UPI00168617E4|nr:MULTISPECIES: hypothetical protein [unclassified Leptolyngbya]MBD1912115.1 hypothetical protein [Leptolyngbya sp. FACHB-8]MBD2155006.1 hypothetical protein [Leptolyngbya sp. FACHB-16]